MSFFKVCMSFIRSHIVGDAVLQEEQVKFIIEISSLLLNAANNASNIFWEFSSNPCSTTVYIYHSLCS